jgi:PKD repeat protein
MKRMAESVWIGKIVLATIVTILFLAAFTAVMNAAAIYVPDDQRTVQDAVNAAGPGDSIIVYDCTYIENVHVNKSLTIESENGAEVTIVQAANLDDHVFEVTADYLNIRVFKVEGATGGEGWESEFYLDGVDHCDGESNRNTSPATSYMPEDYSDYSLIRVGVNNASLGDVIVVYNETYEENVTVNRRGALVVQMNNRTDSRTSVSGWETAKIITHLSKDTDSIQLISVTPPAGTTLQRGTVVPFEVTVDYNLESVATGFVGAELGLSTGRCVIMGREEVTQGHHLYDWLHSDTAYLALSLGYKKDPTHSILLIWKHMPDQYYFISSATPPIASFDYSWATFPESPMSGEVITFDASSSEGTIVSYQWDFGDGETATGRYTTHRFRGAMGEPKEYTVKLTVKDNKGATASYTDSITVYPLKRCILVYSSLSQFLPPPAPKIMEVTVYYNWVEETDGQDEYIVSEVHLDSELSLNFALYMFSIKDEGQVIWKKIHKGVGKEDVSFTYPFNVPRDCTKVIGNEHFEGLAVGHNCNLNFLVYGFELWLDPNDLIPCFFRVSRTIELGPGKQTEVPSIYPEGEMAGILAALSSPAELHIYDSQGNVTGLVNGKIKEEIPNSIYDEESKTGVIFSPEDINSYSYEIVGTDEGLYGLEVTSVEDGKVVNFTATNIPTTPDAIHQYTIDWEALSQGEQGVTVQIDNDGDGTFEQNITTDDTFYPPIASFTYSPAHPVVNELIAFNAIKSNDPDGTITKYEWNFGDGSTMDTTEPIITHSYASIGEYTVNLTVTDDDGATGTNTTTITVLPPDLEITDKWLCWPDNCTICYNVTNIGTGTAPSCHNTALYVDGVAVAHDHVPVELDPGESYIGCFEDYTWTYTPPSDNITVCADNNETLDELDEDNNCLTNIWMCGDVNSDGKVTMSDVRKVFNRYLDPNYPLELPWAADVNCDGKVTMSDVRKVFNRYLDPGYELECCCEGVE